MTALSDALAAAQARAVAALAKQYVGGQIASGEVVERSTLTWSNGAARITLSERTGSGTHDDTG